jgi:hypothetical protein
MRTSAMLTGTEGRATTRVVTLDMPARMAAGRALMGQHTVRVPKMSIGRAAARMEELYGRVKDSTPEQAARLVEDDRMLEQAAIALLKWRLTPIGIEQIDLDRSYADATTAAVGITRWMSSEAKKELLEIAFNVGHPANLTALQNALLAAFPQSELEAAVLDRARSQNELHRMNALSLPYYVFSRPEARLSRAGHAELTKILEATRDSDRSNPLARETLGRTQLPSPA